MCTARFCGRTTRLPSDWEAFRMVGSFLVGSSSTRSVCLYEISFFWNCSPTHIVPTRFLAAYICRYLREKRTRRRNKYEKVRQVLGKLEFSCPSFQCRFGYTRYLLLMVHYTLLTTLLFLAKFFWAFVQKRPKPSNRTLLTASRSSRSPPWHSAIRAYYAGSIRDESGRS